MNDKIFLLSVDEYEKYYDKIPKYDAEGTDYSYWWWLRTPNKYYASSSSSAFFVDGNFGRVRNGIDAYYSAVRPALDISDFDDLEITHGRFTRLGAEWQLIDDNLAIAVEPIFDSEFGKDNNYETSAVRKKLLEWYDREAKKEKYEPYIELGDGKYDLDRIRELDNQELAETLTSIYKAGIDEGIIIGERSDKID